MKPVLRATGTSGDMERREVFGRTRKSATGAGTSGTTPCARTGITVNRPSTTPAALIPEHDSWWTSRP
ncbi:hypothetical protein AB0A94_26620 [Streptomyces sp. NPDC044984]|uniref:hypothetical protein n=1 Tax=Streptomyces sp. NPDC044984 TaxID=3154335 RepID=UPI0034084086